MSIDTRKEHPIIVQLRTLVAAALAGGESLTLEQNLIMLYGNLDRAIQTCYKYAARNENPMPLIISNIRAYHDSLDAIEAMTDAIAADDRVALEAGFTRLEAAAATVVEEGVAPLTERNTEATLNRLVARMLEHSERSALAKAEPLLPVLTLAENVAQANWLKAFDLGRRAMAMGAAESPELSSRVRRLLGTLAPGYHLPMMNDLRRNTAWDKALRQAIKPGMRVLEIGTGAGMLALMAARAGAGLVTTCEFNALVAEVARDVMAQNGYADKVQVLSKSSLAMQVGTDLPERAELLFCDNFSDNMFSFEPLQSIADARARLLVPGAPCLPAGAAVRVALADWTQYERFFGARQACGFDIKPAWVFIPDSVDLELGDAGVRLHSDMQEGFRFDFSAETYPASGHAAVRLEATADCRVSGIAQWIRLDLDADTFVEARPEPGAVFFSNPRFYPLPEPVQLKRGEAMTVHLQHDSKSLKLWAVR